MVALTVRTTSRAWASVKNGAAMVPAFASLPAGDTK